MKEGYNVTATPIISSNHSGQVTGAGGQVNISSATTSVNGGVHTSGSSTTFFGGASHQVSDSASVNMNGNFNNKSSYSVSTGFTFRW